MIILFKAVLVLFTVLFTIIISKMWLDLIIDTFVDKDKHYIFNGIVYTLLAISIVLMLTYSIYFVITCEVVL